MDFITQYNEIRDNNKLKCDFSVYWYDKIKIKSDIRSAPIISEINIKSFIVGDKSTRLKMNFGVRSLNRIGDNIDIIQDTFVTDKMPTVSYGDYGYIKIGIDKSNNYKSFMGFDIAGLSDKYITKADLVLYSQDKNSINLDFGYANKLWRENSITWNYHPNILEPIETKTINGGTYKHSIDIRNIIKNAPSDFNGLCIKTEDNSYKTFLSKDYSDKNYKPYIYIQYLDPENYFDDSDRVLIKSEIRGSSKEDDSLKIKSVVEKDYFVSSIKMKARIKSDTINMTSNISTMDNIKIKSNIRLVKDISMKSNIYGSTALNGIKIKATIPTDKIKVKSKILSYGPIMNIKSFVLYKSNISIRSNITSSKRIYIKSNIRLCNNISVMANIIPVDKSSINIISNIISNRNIDIKSNITQCNNINITANIIPKDKSSVSVRANIYKSKEINSKSNIIAASDVNIKSTVLSANYNNMFLMKSQIVREHIYTKSIILEQKNMFLIKSKIMAVNDDLKTRSNIIVDSNIMARSLITELIVNNINMTAKIQDESNIAIKTNILIVNKINIKSLVYSTNRIKVFSKICIQKDINIKAYIDSHIFNNNINISAKVYKTNDINIKTNIAANSGISISANVFINKNIDVSSKILIPNDIEVLSLIIASKNIFRIKSKIFRTSNILIKSYIDSEGYYVFMI